MVLPTPIKWTFSEPAPRAPSPTPTAAEALGNLSASQRRFRHLCASGSRAEMEDLLAQWSDPVDTLQLYAPGVSSGLREAARNGHRDLLEYLVSQGFSLFDRGPPETIPDAATEGAARTGDTKVLELLLEHGWDLNVSFGPALSPLSLALDNKDIVMWFLAHGANPNGACLFATTVTTIAARRAPLSVLKLLVEHGGTVINTDAIAQAAIGHDSRILDRLEVIDYLVDIGAPIDTYAYSKEDPPNRSLVVGLETALQIATRGGKKDLVELLLSKGADKNIKGGISNVPMCISKGETAVEIAEMKGFEDILRLLKREN